MSGMSGRSSPFEPAGRFATHRDGYELMPFRFFRWSERESLLVHDGGQFHFVGHDDLRALVHGSLDPAAPEYAALEAKLFLVDRPNVDLALELLATQYRTRKAFLDGFTALHLFVVTLRCDHTCRYCQVSRVSEDRSRFDMSEETALRAIDLLFRSPAPYLKVEFQGGEPLLAFERVRFVIDEIERRNVDPGRRIEFVVATTLAPLTDDMLRYFEQHRVFLSISLDGPEHVHNRNRPRPERDSHARTLERLEQARQVLGHDRISALMTTTRASLEHPESVVDEYVRAGFDSIFLRPISPYGFAVKTGEALLYETADFLRFYRRALRHIVELNRQGTDLIEVYAQILLARILTPFATGYVDLQSPAGLGIGGVAYNYDGDVYASDEGRMLAEMGDATFRLGNVHRDTYEEIFGGEVLETLIRGSVLEATPGCADCAFLPWCGCDPVFHHRTQGDPMGHQPTSALCARHMALFRHFLELWRGEDAFVRDLFLRWATGVRP
jgi:uncharacterized protein